MLMNSGPAGVAFTGRGGKSYIVPTLSEFVEPADIGLAYANGWTSAPTQPVVGAPATEGSSLVSVNATNGQTLQIIPQSTAATNANAANGRIDYVSQPFTGAFFNDQVVTFGYNNDSAQTISNAAQDGYSIAWTFETDYGHSVESSAATAGTTTTLLTDSGRAWQTNALKGYTLYNVTRGISQQITANTATTATTAAIAGQVSGDSYQILRRDTETYLQGAFSDGVNIQSERSFFLGVDKALAQSNVTPRTITSATNANPAVFTVAGGHNFGPADNVVGQGMSLYVFFTGLTGGTWGTNLNGLMFLATILSPTTFSIIVNSATFGSLTGGTCYGSCPITSSILTSSAVPLNGLQIVLPSWANGPTLNNLIAQFGTDGRHRLYNPLANASASGQADTVLELHSGGYANSHLDLFGGNFAGADIKTASMTAVEPGRCLLQLFDSGGANAVTLFDFTRASTGQLGNSGLISTTLIGNVSQIVLDTNGVTHNSATLLRTSVALTNNAGATSPTLGTTGPTGATTPTKWIPINDNGTIRNIPAW